MSALFEPGQVLSDRYRVTRILGEGGMGIVAAADHLLLGERVALKALLPSAAANPEVVARFQREARTAARIQSEHVARVLDVGLLPNGLPFLVMEFLEGHDLARELEERGPLPIAEAIDSVLEAAIGVASAHALGIIHRDLKPANLFLAQQPNGRRIVKVLDFGIAKDTLPADAIELTRTTAMFGSAPYMSPEQIRATRSVDVRGDVWAFGVVLFELLTQTWPFGGESVFAMAAAITGDEPASLCTRRPDAPAALEVVIAHCLKKNRDERFASLAELGQALAPFGTARAAALSARIADVLGDTGSPPRSRIAEQAIGAGSSRTGLSVTKEPWSSSTSAMKTRRLQWFSYVGMAAVPVGVAVWTAARSFSPAETPEAPSAAEAPSVTAAAVSANVEAPLRAAVANPSASATQEIAPATSQASASPVELRDSRPARAPQPKRAAPAPSPTARTSASPEPAAPTARPGSALIKDL